jgi:hypothetical protein
MMTLTTCQLFFEFFIRDFKFTAEVLCTYTIAYN